MKFKSIETFDTYGVPHCTDGPAMMWVDAPKEWWINGRWYLEDYGRGVEPPKEYLERLEEMGIEFVRGSDEV